MMTPAFYQSVTRDLPNFPRQVIEQWFDHAVSDGWPPRLNPQGFPLGRWGDVLAHRAMAFWQGVIWTPERARLFPIDLENESELMTAELRNNYLLGLPQRIADSSFRIDAFVRNILATGRMHVPPILLVTGGGFEVLDGFHRLAALFHVQIAGGRTDPLHDVWVARTPIRQVGP